MTIRGCQFSTSCTVITTMKRSEGRRRKRRTHLVGAKKGRKNGRKKKKKNGGRAQKHFVSTRRTGQRFRNRVRRGSGGRYSDSRNDYSSRGSISISE